MSKTCKNCDHQKVCGIPKDYCDDWSGWHDAKKELPKQCGRYFVYRPNYNEEYGGVTECYFDGQNTWHDNNRVDFTRILPNSDVAAWRELPQWILSSRKK